MERIMFVVVMMALSLPANAVTPEFIPTVRQFTISENKPPGTFLATFTATTGTTPLITYSLEVKAQEWFEINNKTGNTTVKKTIDREAMPGSGGNFGSFTFLVYAKNADGQGEQKVVVTITDVNEPPAFTNLPRTINIPEDQPTGQTIFTISSKDDDEGPNSQTTLTIESGNENGTFRIDATRGHIILEKPLDFDKGVRQYSLSITANNTQVQPYLSASAVLVINVQNANDLGFEFLQNVYEAQAIKGSAVGTLVTKVKARDLDSLNETEEYKIYQESNPGNRFAINSSTGDVTVKGNLEIGNQILIVQAISKKYGAAVTMVNVSVVAVLSKQFQADAIEGQPNMDVFNLQSTESSFGIFGATFTIESGNYGNHFVINSNSLKVGVQPLDREDRPGYSLVVKLMKTGVVKGLAVVTVKVLDINDNSPHFQHPSPYNVTVKEDIDTGSNIVKVTAVDPDQDLNGTVKYTIINGNDQGLFTMDNATGQITLSAHLDREKSSVHNLTVEAYDGGSPSRTNTTTVMITVEDVNDNSPEISPVLITANVYEDASNGHTVVVIKASDADTGQNAKITYSIVSGADGHFTINPETGEITKSGSLSHKLKPTYTIVVEARDNGTSPRSTRVVMMVSVISKDSNTHSPVFKSPSYVGAVYKDTSDLTLVLTVSAVDRDTGSNGDMDYHLLRGGANGLFFMESSTGNLKTSNSFTGKEGEKYTLTSQAKDKAVSPKVSDPNAAIYILVLRDSNSAVITAEVNQGTLLSNLQEFKSVLDDLTDGKAFIKTIRPGTDSNSTLVIFNVVDVSNQTEKTYEQISQTLGSKQSLITGKYQKWKIVYGRPETSAFTSHIAQGLSATVGALICFAIMIGIGGIIMIIILLRKRRAMERVRKAARVKFDDKPQFIEPPINKPSLRNNVEDAQEAQEVIVHMSDETSSIASEEIQTSPDVMEYINEGYQRDTDSDNGSFYMDGERVKFGTFFPPPPTQPPPPIPDSETCESSLHSEEVSIPSDDEDDEDEEDDYDEDDTKEYIDAVLPPHEDFANPNHIYAEVIRRPHNESAPDPSGDYAEVLHPFGVSPTHSVTDSTTHLVENGPYHDRVLHDPNYGLSGALRTSINKDLTTEL